MICKSSGSRPELLRVRFRLPGSLVAHVIHVVGDFNGWNRRADAMARSDDTGDWHLDLELERGRTYQFRYLVDGATWQNDWHADRYVPNPFGGENSVLET